MQISVASFPQGDRQHQKYLDAEKTSEKDDEREKPAN
jgi:hypothetical protein